ncbi:MAG: nuclear transport factor 2 family protein [Myxococcota bacterium]|nr:nuclear transport factor 2 family protein [Myxococcales bacterium]
MPPGPTADLAFRFFRALGRGDREALRALVHDDFRWVVPKGAVQHAGVHAGAERVFDAMLGAVGDAFVAGSQRTDLEVVVEDGGVAFCEARVRARAPDGREYDNAYVFVFVARDGRLAELREHVDTRYAAAFFGPGGDGA